MGLSPTRHQPRRPIGVAATAGGPLGVVCDDGAVFVAVPDPKEPTVVAWEEITPVPGTARSFAGAVPGPGATLPPLGTSG